MTVDVPAARAIEILTDLVGFDTVSSKSNLDLIHYIRDFLARRGITAEILPNETGDKANLFATIGPARAQGVVLSGHTDVVPVTDQAWTSDPFTLTRRGDRLYGRGAADMKAFIACALAALDHHDPDALRQPIHLAFSYDEEVGCLGSPALIERISDRIERPVVTIVGEPSLMRIIGSHKSVLYYRVDVTGVPAHSSATHLGVSANAIAIPLMNRLLEIAGALRTGEDQDPDFQPSFSTLTVGLMNGGTAPNILAGDASFTFDLRALPQMDPARILAPFWDAVEAARAANPDSTIGVERLAYVPAFVKVADGEAERLVRAIGGDNLDMVAGSFGAEAGQFQAAGFPTVICGPGSIDQAHQADEYIEVSEIDRCMRFMAKLYARLSGARAGAFLP